MYKRQLLTNDRELSELVDLQKRLLLSGFRQLKPGGSLVYSTCSLSDDQNENVVQWLLDQETHAHRVPIQFAKINSPLVVHGKELYGTVRFYPNIMNPTATRDDKKVLLGDGFFLAKLQKHPQ